MHCCVFLLFLMSVSQLVETHWSTHVKKNVCVCVRQLKRLSEDSLTKQPEEVLDVLEKLGEG